MRKFLAALVIILGMCTSAFVEGIVGNSKIAVMDLGTREGAVPFEINIFNAGKEASEYLIQRFATLDNFDVMDRTLVKDKLKATNLNTTGLIDPDTAKEIGKILGADHLVYGNVNDVTLSETGASTLGVGLDISTATVKAHIIVRVMDVSTGKIISAAKGEGKSKGSFVRVKAAPFATLSVGRTKITQNSVHNVLQQAAFQSVDILFLRSE